MENHPTFDALYQAAHETFYATVEYGTRPTATQCPGSYVALSALPKPQQFAFVLGNMDGQVCNGGWDEWMGNGYAWTAPFIFVALEGVGTEAARTAVRIFRRVMAICRESDARPGDDYSLDLDDLDERYYEVDDQLRDDIEAWFVRTGGES